LTAISIAVILYSQYTKEKAEVISDTHSLINSRLEFISEVLWNMDESLAELSIKSLADNPNITYIAIIDENEKTFTKAGLENISFTEAKTYPLVHKGLFTDQKQYLEEIISFKKSNDMNSDFVDIKNLSNNKEYITNKYAYLVPNDGEEEVLTPVELTFIPTKFGENTEPKSLDEHDLFARIGGDEFAVLFNSDTKASKKKSVKIIADLEGLDFTFDDQILPISCSIGITDLSHDDKSIESVMTRADEACYQVKRNGKGHVEIFKSNVTNLQPLLLVNK